MTRTYTPNSWDFLRFSLEQGVLRFGRFQTKAGRMSPYFFNAGLFHDGHALAQLGKFYARAIHDSGIAFDMIFGPAYKGIPLVAATAIAYSQNYQRNLPFAFNRKEAKDHGEGGTLIGAPLQGKVLILDDVISAGTSVRESVALIRAAGAELAGVAIALDRQERGSGATGAVQEVNSQLGVPVIAIARLEDLLQLLESMPEHAEPLAAIQEYRRQYGTS